MAMRVDPRQRRLDEISLGEAGPSEAFPLIRELLSDDASKFAKRVYLTLQDVVLRIASDRVPIAEAVQWMDVCGRASVMMRQGGADAFAHQVSALGELVERTTRFFEAQPADEVLGKRHVPDVLRLLAGSGGRMGRAAILEATGLGQSNLSRMLTMLERHGLVRRSKSGREAELFLTEAGEAAITRLDGEGARVRPEVVWQASGIGVCVSADDGTVLSANPRFEEAVGTPAEVAAASTPVGSGAEDVATAENRWVRRVEIGKVDGGTASVWVDVSDLHLSLAEAERRISAVEAKAAGLKEALAKAEASAAAAERRLRRQQLSVEVVRDRAVGRLGSMAKLIHEKFSGRGQAAQQAGDRPFHQIVAIKDALNNLLGVQVISHRHHHHLRENGLTMFEDMVKSTYALTNSKIDVKYPDWLQAEKADYRALIEPLSQFLLIGYEAVEMRITRDDRNVVVQGFGRSTLESAGSHCDHFKLIDPSLVGIFEDTWAGLGVDVHVSGVSSHDQGVGFRMSVPRGVDRNRKAVA